MNYPLVTKYGDESRWMNWRLEKVDGKMTKVPYKTKTQRGSSTNPNAWTTYWDAQVLYDNGFNDFNGVAIVLHNKKLLCIDIDHVVEERKVVSPFAEQILVLLKKANTFTEISQSGTGLHLYFDLSFEFDPMAKKKAPFEIYTDGRYICVTNDSYDTEPKEVRTISTEKELLNILESTGYPWGKKEIAPQVQSDSVFTNEYIIKKMFSSKNGQQIKSIYNGDVSTSDNDHSKADHKLLSALAFWTQKNHIQMEELWKESPLGSREKTQNRKDYRDRSIINAISNCNNIYVPTNIKKITPFLVVSKSTKEGVIEVVIPCKENVLIALRNTEEIVGKFRYNIWMERSETLLYSNSWRAVKDNDYLEVQSILSNAFKDVVAIVVAPLAHVTNAIDQYCEENSIDPVKVYVESLVWDNTPRLSTWLHKACNTEGNEEEYATFGTQWLKALVKRVIEPGCKFDNVLVFEGLQGTKKSAAFNALGREYHVEITTNPNNKDFFLSMSGKMIVEFSEGETQERASMKLLKSIITTQVDTYRSPYGKKVADHPRRCVFAMTTNDSAYLKDETGNRRWFPVKCNGDLNTEWIAENREQLFAEAYHRAIVLKENLYDGLNTENIRQMQNDRRIERSEEDYIYNWLNNLSHKAREEGFTALEVFDGALSTGKEDRMNQLQLQVIPGILRNVFFFRDGRKEGRRAYYPTEKTWTIIKKEKEIW